MSSQAYERDLYSLDFDPSNPKYIDLPKSNKWAIARPIVELFARLTEDRISKVIIKRSKRSMVVMGSGKVILFRLRPNAPKFQLTFGTSVTTLEYPEWNMSEQSALDARCYSGIIFLDIFYRYSIRDPKNVRWAFTKPDMIVGSRIPVELEDPHRMGKEPFECYNILDMHNQIPGSTLLMDIGDGAQSSEEFYHYLLRDHRTALTQHLLSRGLTCLYSVTQKSMFDGDVVNLSEDLHVDDVEHVDDDVIETPSILERGSGSSTGNDSLLLAGEMADLLGIKIGSLQSLGKRYNYLAPVDEKFYDPKTGYTHPLYSKHGAMCYMAFHQHDRFRDVVRYNILLNKEDASQFDDLLKTWTNSIIFEAEE